MLHGPRGWPLEVNSDSELDEEVELPYDDLASFCQKLLEKYDLLKIEHDKWKKENNSLLKEKRFFSNWFWNYFKENKSLKNQVALISKEKEIILNENEFLKKKIIPWYTCLSCHY